jgi:hypothetical protein
MEPERKIEKWLKAYAKKRRTKAGEPFNLHPATRRLLQSEVARDKPKPDNDDESVSLWEVIRQQWALLLSFAACIFLVGIIILPVTYYAVKNKSRQFATASGAREIGSDANAPSVSSSGQIVESLDDKKDTTLARNDMRDREINPGVKEEERKALVEKDTLYATNGAPLPAVAMTGTPSAAPGVSHSIGVTPLEVSPGSSAIPPEPAGGAYIAGQAAQPLPIVTNSLNGSYAMTPPPPPLVAASAPGGDFLAGKPAEHPMAPSVPVAAPPVQTTSWGQNTATFSSQLKSDSEMGPVASRRAGELQNVFKNSSEPSQASPVLSNFQVQQNGNTIRLVDQDGSIYDGSLELAKQQVQKVEDQTAGAANYRLAQNAMTVAAGLPSQQITAAQDALQFAKNYFFYVYGTNRTTKQTVSFTGNLGANVVPTNVANQTFGLTKNPANAGGGGFGGGGGGELAVGGNFDRTKSEATNQFAPLPWADLRITGTAVVNRTNCVEIYATPVAPNKP